MVNRLHLSEKIPLSKSAQVVYIPVPVESDGTLACWDNNENGQATPPTVGTFTRVRSGWSHTCAIKRDGTVICWGDNFHRGMDHPASNIFTQIV